MMLLPQERAVIEQAFGCKVTDRYGCEEVALIACECEQHRGMHLNIEHLVIEFLDDDGRAGSAGRGRPHRRHRPLQSRHAADPLRSGRCRAFPATAPATAAVELPLMERVIGRVADYLKRRDGSQVAGVSLVERTLTKVSGVEQMQIVQPAIGRLIVNYVPAASLRCDPGRACERNSWTASASRWSIEFRAMERIPQERSGKYRFSICQV